MSPPAPNIDPNVMQILRTMKTRPSSKLMSAETKRESSMLAPSKPEEEEEANTTQDYLVRDLTKSPEERRAIQRIRQPMSPIIQQLILEKERDKAREQSAKQIQIKSHLNQSKTVDTDSQGGALETKQIDIADVVSMLEQSIQPTVA